MLEHIALEPEDYSGKKISGADTRQIPCHNKLATHKIFTALEAILVRSDYFPTLVDQGNGQKGRPRIKRAKILTDHLEIFRKSFF